MCKTITKGQANRRSSTSEYTTQRSLPDFSKGVLVLLFIRRLDLGICPFAEIYPHGPICLCFFISLLSSFFSKLSQAYFSFHYYSPDLWPAGNRLFSDVLRDVNERSCPLEWQRNERLSERASEQSVYLYQWHWDWRQWSSSIIKYLTTTK